MNLNIVLKFLKKAVAEQSLRKGLWHHAHWNGPPEGSKNLLTSGEVVGSDQAVPRMDGAL